MVDPCKVLSPSSTPSWTQGRSGPRRNLDPVHILHSYRSSTSISAHKPLPLSSNFYVSVSIGKNHLTSPSVQTHIHRFFTFCFQLTHSHILTVNMVHGLSKTSSTGWCTGTTNFFFLVRRYCTDDVTLRTVKTPTLNLESSSSPQPLKIDFSPVYRSHKVIPSTEDLCRTPVTSSGPGEVFHQW